MQNFIVLGIIPGTSIQLNFDFWVGLTIVWLLSPIVRKIWRNRANVYNFWIAMQVSRFIDRYQLPA